MTDQPHGRYFAQELVPDQDAEIRGRIQDALDAGEMGVAPRWGIGGPAGTPHRAVLGHCQTQLRQNL
jgi:hypothetical protein